MHNFIYKYRVKLLITDKWLDNGCNFVIICYNNIYLLEKEVTICNDVYLEESYIND